MNQPYFNSFFFWLFLDRLSPNVAWSWLYVRFVGCHQLLHEWCLGISSNAAIAAVELVNGNAFFGLREEVTNTCEQKQRDFITVHRVFGCFILFTNTNNKNYILRETCCLRSAM